MKIPAKRKVDNNDEDDRLVCKICGGKFNHLGSHIWHKHKIKTIDYKKEFGLPLNFALISRKVLEKKQARFEENREYYLSNLTKGKDYQFKKGVSMPKCQYRSESSVMRAISNLEKMNKGRLEKCPVCGLFFNKLDSHLYNKHRLLRVS